MHAVCGYICIYAKKNPGYAFSHNKALTANQNLFKGLTHLKRKNIIDDANETYS